MAKYEVTYTCGHPGVVNLIGPHKDREWKLEREKEKCCPECWARMIESERKQNNEEAAEANRMAGLPELQGTEKQITWAETIRRQIIDAIQEDILNENSPDALIKAFNGIKSHSAASWWIDNRKCTIFVLKELLAAEHEALKKAQTEPPAAIIDDVKAEATVYPEKTVSNLVAEITIQNNKTIEVHYPERNEDFRLIMRGREFKWDDGWKRTIDKFSGSVEDRAAEIGNKLLAAGFPILIYDEDIRKRAVAGEYSPEPTRWIMAVVDGNYKGWLSISWPYEGDNYYDAARKIPGSKYNRPNVVVPPESYQEVLGFAKIYDFSISEKAQTIIETSKQLKETALVTGVKTPKFEQPPKPGTKPEPLEVPEEVNIDEEFRDDN